MLQVVVVAVAVVAALRPEAERLQPLAAAVGRAHRQAIVLARRASEAAPAPQPRGVLEDDDSETQGLYVALIDAELALKTLADEWPPVMDRRQISAVALELTNAREALSDYTAARSEGRRIDMREAAEGMRTALGRAGAVIADAAERAPESREQQ